MVDATLPERIKSIYKTCSSEEKQTLKQILQEFSDYGDSDTYKELWLADFKEIPVTINEFISSETYLGKVTRGGDAIYPAWKSVLKDIFGAGNAYQEVILTGATRIGKTSTAITGVAYLLYWLMCLRDPQKFFGKKEESKFAIAFFNITKELAAGVAFREFNDTLRASPWFCAHGSFSASERNFYYIPEGDKIVLVTGSDAAHFLGLQIFCVVGDTEILTSDGPKRIQDLAGKRVELAQYNDHGEIEYHFADVIETKKVQETVRITLDNGSVIEGTPDHRIMLSNGDYKMLKDIQESDDILTFNTDEKR